MYLTEISPTHLRGAIGTIYQLVITISILTSNVLGLPQILGTEAKWPLLFGIVSKFKSIENIIELSFLKSCDSGPCYFYAHDSTVLSGITQIYTYISGKRRLRTERFAFKHIIQCLSYSE